MAPQKQLPTKHQYQAHQGKAIGPMAAVVDGQQHYPDKAQGHRETKNKRQNDLQHPFLPGVRKLPWKDESVGNESKTYKMGGGVVVLASPMLAMQPFRARASHLGDQTPSFRHLGRRNTPINFGVGEMGDDVAEFALPRLLNQGHQGLFCLTLNEANYIS
ncbi:hypothetical protein FDECE_16634 [Fusarium decemcellulare]|nr:hypothetical protein FDECE_16634 [Fusarium decemcellulare]